MFDISIGTLIPYNAASEMIPLLNPKGFECYELDFNGSVPENVDFSAYGEEILPRLEGRKISAIGFYRNPILNESDRHGLEVLIRNAKTLGCDVIGAFAGANPEKTIPETIADFKRVGEPLAALAEENGVRIGFEGCGGGWYGGSWNIGYCPEAWELMFDAVNSQALGLEWEPTHAIEGLADPIAQLRRWAKKVVHVHGKDGTVAWDVIRESGINGPRPYVWNRTPGFGDTNWADIFTILLQSGFEGACDIEGYHDPVHYDDMEWSAQVASLEYLKNCRGGKVFFDAPGLYHGYQGKRK